jgi:phage shock protein PspC (stress-responsive transcriptional regulator)
MVRARVDSYVGGMDESAVTPDETQSVTPPPPTPPPPGAPRLHRSSTHKVFGGVAGGLAERFDLDPNLVRVGFVILSIAWGLGVLVYLAMWALIPRDSAASELAQRAPATGLARGWPYYLLAGALVLVALLALALFTHHHPHPWPHGLVVGQGIFALWILVLAVLAVVALRSSMRRVSFLRFFAIVIAAFLSVVILVSGAALTFLATTGVPLTGGTGERMWNPTRLADVRSTYRTEFGAATVDLHAVRFPASGYRVSASVAIGQLTIELPANVVVDLHTHVGAGTIHYGIMQPWGFEGAYFSALPGALSGAALAKAPHLTLDAQVGVGQILLARVPVSTGG